MRPDSVKMGEVLCQCWAIALASSVWHIVFSTARDSEAGSYSLTMHDLTLLVLYMVKAEWHSDIIAQVTYSGFLPKALDNDSPRGTMICTVLGREIYFCVSPLGNKSETGPTLLLWLKSLTRPSEHVSRGYLITGRCLRLCLFDFYDGIWTEMIKGKN